MKTGAFGCVRETLAQRLLQNDLKAGGVKKSVFQVDEPIPEMAKSGTNVSGKGQFGRIRPENGISGPAGAIRTGFGAQNYTKNKKIDENLKSTHFRKKGVKN